MSSWISGNRQLTDDERDNNGYLVADDLLGRRARWALPQVAAIIGNMQQESHINPGIYSTGGSFGLLQWGAGNLPRMRDWLYLHGYNFDSGTGQCQFLVNEGNTNTNWYMRNAPLTMPTWQSFLYYNGDYDSVGDLTETFARNYVFPNLQQDFTNRRNAGRRWYRLLENYKPRDFPYWLLFKFSERK